MTTRPLGASARQSERIQPAIQIAVSELGSPEGMVLWNVSDGGFAVQSVAPYYPGQVLAFVFSAPSQALSETVLAKAVHSMVFTNARGTSYISGFQFVPAPERTSAITRILNVAKRAGMGASLTVATPNWRALSASP
jgi:hypothetical protein